MAGSGGGKDHARSAIKEAFIAAGPRRYLGDNRTASGSGLLTTLHRQPSSLFQLDEFGQFLGNVVSKRHAPKYLDEIWDLLTMRFSGSMAACVISPFVLAGAADGMAEVPEMHGDAARGRELFAPAVYSSVRHRLVLDESSARR